MLGENFVISNDQDIVEVALTRNFTTEAPLSFTVQRLTDGVAWANVWNVASISWTQDSLVFSKP